MDWFLHDNSLRHERDNAGGSLAILHLPDKFDDHGHCNGEDLMFLICHVTSRDCVLQYLYHFNGENPSR